MNSNSYPCIRLSIPSCSPCIPFRMMSSIPYSQSTRPNTMRNSSNSCYSPYSPRTRLNSCLNSPNSPHSRLCMCCHIRPNSLPNTRLSIRFRSCPGTRSNSPYSPVCIPHSPNSRCI